MLAGDRLQKENSMMAQIIANGVIAGCAYALVALGFGLIFSVCGFFHLAHGAVYTVAAYSAYTFICLCGWSPWVGVPVAIIAATAVGALIEIIVYKPMRRFGASSLTLLICSLGIMVAIQNGISLVFGDDTKLLRSTGVYEGIAVFGAHITPIQFIIVGASVLLSTSLFAWIRLSRYGKITRAVASDPGLATIVGIDSPRVVLMVFGLGSALAAVAAILIGYDTDLTPAMGFKSILMAVVAVIVGGIGSVRGSLLGGLLVGLVQHLGVWRLPTQWQDAIVFVVLIVFLIVRPEGFFGKPLKSGQP